MQDLAAKKQVNKTALLGSRSKDVNLMHEINSTGTSLCAVLWITLRSETQNSPEYKTAPRFDACVATASYEWTHDFGSAKYPMCQQPTRSLDGELVLHPLALSLVSARLLASEGRLMLLKHVLSHQAPH